MSELDNQKKEILSQAKEIEEAFISNSLDWGMINDNEAHLLSLMTCTLCYFTGEYGLQFRFVDLDQQ